MGRIWKILAIDGGGIRGIIPALMLAEIEAQTGRRIVDLFDLIAGTSTGGILALGLTKPDPKDSRRPQFKASELKGFYYDDGPTIFSGYSWRSLPFIKAAYPSSGIESVLTRVFGSVTLSSALQRVLVPAYDLERRSPILFDSMLAKARPEKYDHEMWFVGRATSAAPTYFSPLQVEDKSKDLFSLVDGGVFANNPALLALSELEYRLRNDGDEILVVSLGCGDAIEQISHAQASKWWLVNWARHITDITFDGQSKSAHNALSRLLNTTDKQSYWRFQIQIPKNINPAMDNPALAHQLHPIAMEVVEGHHFAMMCRALADAASKPVQQFGITKSSSSSDKQLKPLFAIIGFQSDAEVVESVERALKSAEPKKEFAHFLLSTDKDPREQTSQILASHDQVIVVMTPRTRDVQRPWYEWICLRMINETHEVVPVWFGWDQLPPEAASNQVSFNQVDLSSNLHPRILELVR